MAFLSEVNTSVAEPVELSLFSDPPNQVAVQKIYFSEIRPISSFEGDTAPLEFAVPGGGNEYLDLRRSRLYVKAKITALHWHPPKRRASSTCPYSHSFHRLMST